MRIFLTALALAFTLGSTSAAWAGEGCDYGGHGKKNDFETPPPASSQADATQKQT